MMEHWRKVLPVPLLEVDYEETVADLEGVARRLVAWCGLEWEPGCLEFHQAKRPVTNGQRRPGPPAGLQDIGGKMEALRAGPGSALRPAGNDVMATISEALAIAIQHHQAGRLQAAEQIYRQILAAEPNHADAIHLLGVIASQVGKHEIAVEYIQRAIRLQGNAAFFHNNLGEAYRALRRIPEAVACYRRALELKPDYAEAHCNLGTCLEGAGQTGRSGRLLPPGAGTEARLRRARTTTWALP